MALVAPGVRRHRGGVDWGTVACCARYHNSSRECGEGSGAVWELPPSASARCCCDLSYGPLSAMGAGAQDGRPHRPDAGPAARPPPGRCCRGGRRRPGAGAHGDRPARPGAGTAAPSGPPGGDVGAVAIPSQPNDPETPTYTFGPAVPSPRFRRYRSGVESMPARGRAPLRRPHAQRQLQDPRCPRRSRLPQRQGPTATAHRTATVRMAWPPLMATGTNRPCINSADEHSAAGATWSPARSAAACRDASIARVLNGTARNSSTTISRSVRSGVVRRCPTMNGIPCFGVSRRVRSARCLVHVTVTAGIAERTGTSVPRSRSATASSF